MATTTTRCDRILALIDECLDAVAALVDTPGEAITFEPEREGGHSDEHR